jgi:hypothetical protein
MVIASAALICLLPAAALAALTPYNQNFETLDQLDPLALGDDNWVVYGTVFAADGTTWLYGYGTYPAPNGTSAFCDIAADQGGLEQGIQQLSVYSDYNNTGAHTAGQIVESNVFHEQTIVADDAGDTWVFTFDAKRGNIVSPSTATAFIKTLNPAAGYATTNYIWLDMTAIPETWANYSISIPVTANLAGQLLQFGFANRATAFQSSAIIYDNVIFGIDTTTSSVPTASAAMGAELRQNYPNPFNPSTRIEFALERTSSVQVTVFDLAGHRLATLEQGTLAAGEHHVTWDGRTDDGTPAPAGQYRYVLTTDQGQLSRSMVLIK